MSASFSPVTRSAIAVILGGGRGTRLWPLTKYRAKPAVPMAGKYRLIDIPISNCLNSGLDRIYVFTQFNSSSLNRHISATYQLDPFSRGFVTLEVANQSEENSDWYQGTADSVRRNHKTIAQWQAAHVIILPGDTIFRMDLSRLLELHIAKNADVTIALHSTEESRVPSFGIISMESDQRITGMVEKPTVEHARPYAVGEPLRRQLGMSADKPYLASMGIYVFKAAVLADLIRDPQVNDFGHDILPMAVKQRPVFGYVFNDFWEDVGTIRAMYQVNLDLVRPHPPFQFYLPEAPIYTRMRFLPSTQVDRAELRETSVAEGCLIEQAAQLDHCMVGLRSRIGRAVRMHQTVMMGADYYETGEVIAGFEPVPADAPMMGVGDECEIERALIDKNARVGAGCRILNRAGRKNYDDPAERYYIRDGITIIPKHAILPPGTEI